MTSFSLCPRKNFPLCMHTAAAAAAAAAAKSLQSCPTLCDIIDSSPPGSPIPGILQARTLEWVAISFSNAWKWKVKVKSLSRVQLFATPWTAAYQAPPSMGFSRQEYWSGLPSPSLGNRDMSRQMATLPLGDKTILFPPLGVYFLSAPLPTSSLMCSIEYNSRPHYGLCQREGNLPLHF